MCPEDAPHSSQSTTLSPRAERKLAQVIEGARSVLIAKGFEGASVDDIAREAGISKATMYRYFPDKTALFAAVMNQECTRQMSEALEFEACCESKIDVVLLAFAVRHLKFVLSDLALDTFRTAVAESARFPQLARDFHTRGISVVRDTLMPILARAAERGEIDLDGDAKAAAMIFLALCKGDLMYQRLFGLTDTISDDQIAAQARRAVVAFMKIYAVRS